MNTENQDGRKVNARNRKTGTPDEEKSDTRGIVFLKKLNNLDASLVAEAAQEENILRFPKRRRLKFAAAAALLAVCLTVGGGIVAASVFGIRIFDVKSDKDTSSYGVGSVVRYRPQDAFRGHIDEVKDVIQKQCEEYKPWYSSIPNLWHKEFDDWESALAYLEIDFMEAPVTSRQPTSVGLSVMGTKEGPLQSVRFVGSYLSERYNIYVSADIYVDDSKAEVTAQTFSATGGEAQYSNETYLTANGFPCMLVDTVVSERDGSTHAEGYIVKDGIMYGVCAVPQQRNGEPGEDRMEIVKELLEEIAGK